MSTDYNTLTSMTNTNDNLNMNNKKVSPCEYSPKPITYFAVVVLLFTGALSLSLSIKAFILHQPLSHSLLFLFMATFLLIPAVYGLILLIIYHSTSDP